MPNDIIADRNIDRGLEANETSFLNKDVADAAIETKDAVVDAFTFPENTGQTEQEQPFNIIAERESTRDIAPNSISFLSNTANEVANGLGNNLANMVTDYADALPDTQENDIIIADKALAMTEKYGWDTTMVDELMAQSSSPEEVERRANRIFEQQAYMASMETAPMAQQLAAGITGFVLDPVNLIPGGVILKAGAATAKVMPKLTNALTRTQLGKTGTYAAMGATEEAMRNYPRLMNDPTYSYEMYRLDVAIGAGFGSAIALGGPATRLAFNKITAGIRKATDKFAHSVEARMAVNTMKDALNVTKNPKSKADLEAAIDAAMPPGARRTEVTMAKVAKAQEQVNNSKVNSKVRDMESDVKQALDATEDFSPDAILAQFAKELKDTSPTFAKIAEAITTRVQRAADKTEPQSMGAAKRKTTPRTVAEDLAADHEIARKALDDIDAAFDAATGVAKSAKDFNTERALGAMRSAAKRAVIEKAKIKGVSTRKIKYTAKYVDQVVGSKFKRYQKVINEADNELNEALKKYGSTERNVLSSTIHKALFTAGTSVKKLHKDLAKDPNLGQSVEVNLDSHFEDLIDRIYTGSTNVDGKLYESLYGAYNKVRADIQWAMLAVKERSPEQIALDPEWSMMSHDFQVSMGGNLNLLDEIYNSGFNKTLRNQFGGFTRSYAGELAASKTPLAQWAALNIFELPGGTGGKIARNETAAISMEMFEAAATHPVNVAWDKATRLEAKAMGLNLLDSAVMRHSSAAADKNANALGRKVQLEMNARQMGMKSDAPAHVKEYADALEKAYDHLYNIQYKHGVQGITGTNKLKAYTSQRWSEKRVMDAMTSEGIGMEGLEKLIMFSLKSRNPGSTQVELRKAAMTVTKRMNDNVTKRDGTNSENIISDGDYINERKLHLDLSAELEINGQQYSVLDFMSNDVTSDLNKYAKKTAASAAISKASNGRLNSAEAIRGFIHATGQESQALGTNVDVGTLTDSFKLMMGEPIKGFDPRVRKIRDAVALSGMNGLGESQLAELGLAMNRGTAAVFAAKQVASRVKGKYNSRWRAMELTPEQASNTSLLQEMQSVSTLYEQMHNLARQNVHFDDAYHGESTSSTVAGLNKVVDVATGGKYRPVLQHVQTKHTGYGSIRTMQEQISMAGLMHDVGRNISGKKSMTSDARLADIGVPMNLIRKKVKDGTIQLDKEGNIQTLGLGTWSEMEKHSLGVALRRHSAQQVQVGFAGEQSALMNNPWVAFMMQFRTYPNIAAEKQQMRNAMFMDKEAAMGQALNAASSMGARVIRYQSLAMGLPEDKREAYLNRKYDNLLHDTALYMGGVGSMMNTYDIIRDPSNGIPPVVSWANNYRKAITGLGNGVSNRDVANMAYALPLGSIAQLNFIRGTIADASNVDDSEQSADFRNRGN